MTLYWVQRTDVGEQSDAHAAIVDCPRAVGALRRAEELLGRGDVLMIPLPRSLGVPPADVDRALSTDEMSVLRDVFVASRRRTRH